MTFSLFRAFDAFQLTPSRMATVFLYHVLRHGEYFNSRPHGGRRTTNAGAVGTIISTHALTEGDATKVLFRSLYAFQLTPSRRATHLPENCTYSRIFQLTPSRRATNSVTAKSEDEIISTHALTEGDQTIIGVNIHNDISTHALTEGDAWRSGNPPDLIYFNSRPHGGRRHG